MTLLVIDNHDGEGTFPVFKKGTTVNNIALVNDESHWYSCVIDGHKTYIPDIYVADGVLTKDYDPTEIIVKKDQSVTLIAVVFEWLYVKDENRKMGWLPANKVISVF